MVRSVQEVGVQKAGDLLVKKKKSPRCYSYSEEDNRYDFWAMMQRPLYYTSVKFINLKNTFVIKDSRTKHIRGADICYDPDMEYSYFTKNIREV